MRVILRRSSRLRSHLDVERAFRRMGKNVICAEVLCRSGKASCAVGLPLHRSRVAASTWIGNARLTGPCTCPRPPRRSILRSRIQRLPAELTSELGAAASEGQVVRQVPATSLLSLRIFLDSEVGSAGVRAHRPQPNQPSAPGVLTDSVSSDQAVTHCKGSAVTRRALIGTSSPLPRAGATCLTRPCTCTRPPRRSIL